MITAALGRIAAERGLTAVTMREVAAEADISLGLVQHYFSSKDELLLAALRHLAEHMAKRTRRAVLALGPNASERDRIRVTLTQFLPLDDDRRAATVLFRAFHAGGVNDASTTGADAARVPQAFHDTMVRRLDAARRNGELRDDVAIDVDKEAAIYQLVITSLSESVLHGLVSASQAKDTIDYLLDRSFTRA